MPAPTKVQLTGGAFQDSEGNVLDSGYLIMRLSQDESITGVGQIASGIDIKITLNSSGNVNTSPAQSVWGNDQMLPVNSFYRVFGYKSDGQLAWGPNNQQVNGNGGTFDVGTWTPNRLISWVPPVQSLSLQTNEVANGSQSLLDLHAGTNITLTDNGSGRVTIDAASGGGFTTAGRGGFWSANVDQNVGLAQNWNVGTLSLNVEDEVWVWQFSLLAATTIRHFSFWSIQAATGGPGIGQTATWGLYDASGAKIFDTGAFDAGNPLGLYSTSITLALPAGTYYFAESQHNPSGGFKTLITNPNRTEEPMKMMNAFAPRTGLAANAAVAGVLPATLGVITAQDGVTVYKAMSMVFFAV